MSLTPGEWWKAQERIEQQHRRVLPSDPVARLAERALWCRAGLHRWSAPNVTMVIRANGKEYRRCRLCFQLADEVSKAKRKRVARDG